MMTADLREDNSLTGSFFYLTLNSASKTYGVPLNVFPSGQSQLLWETLLSLRLVLALIVS